MVQGTILLGDTGKDQGSTVKEGAARGGGPERVAGIGSRRSLMGEAFEPRVPPLGFVLG